MVKTVLEKAGFVENKTFKETRFLKPPTVTYCIYEDAIERRGGDGYNCIIEHDYTIEMYQYEPDKDAEKRIENALDSLGIEYTKQPRYFIQEEGLFQIIYEFEYITKGA